MHFAACFHTRMCSRVIDFQICRRIYELFLVWHCNLVDSRRRSEGIRRLEKAQIESRLTLDASYLRPGADGPDVEGAIFADLRIMERRSLRRSPREYRMAEGTPGSFFEPES